MRHSLRQIALLLVVLLFTGACTSAAQTAAESTPAPAATEPAAAVQLPTPTAAPADAAAQPPANSAAITPTTAGVTTTPITDTPAATTAVTATTPATQTTATAAPPDLNAIKLKLDPVITGLDQPLFVTTAGDGTDRLFVLEKTGRIRIFTHGQLLPTPFLDISGQVSGDMEQGLLGLAFDPHYMSTGHFWINYTDTAGDTQIVRYTVSAADPNVADPATAFPVLTLDQPAPNHNGGMLLFGPDGKLWVGTGDGGGANDVFGNGQNPATLFAKMLRLDVTSDPTKPYTIPPDNPWLTQDWNGQKVVPEAWAIGLRNPWRYSFDRATGDFWIGDVGQNQIEEVDMVPAGTPGGINFGWPIMEGKSCFQQATCNQQGLWLPIIDYPHNGHCSVTAGYVYRGAQFPAWNGIYFYGDYCSGTIWALAPNGSGGWNNLKVRPGGWINLSSFGEDAAGELYATDISGGTVYHLTQGQ